MITVAIVDSGVNPRNPHVGGLAGGVAVHADGTLGDDYTDRLGHGTAVLAAIHEKATWAALWAVKVFDRVLSADIEVLVAALDWAVSRRMRLVNLSLGTSPEHEARLEAAVVRAASSGTWIVAAAADESVRWLPGSLDGVIGVTVDWDCPRDQCRIDATAGGRLVVRASGYPRPIPGVPPERNLKGISFAVANATGLLADTLARHPSATLDEALALAAQGVPDRLGPLCGSKRKCRTR